MAIPARVSGITVDDTVMYNDDYFVISWNTVPFASGYKLYIKNENEQNFKIIYTGTASAYNIDMADYTEYSRMKFRVYAYNADGDSAMPCDSLEVTVIDIEIEECADGSVVLQPFGLLVNMQASKFDDVPSVRESSETITGLDGEIPVDMKYSPRLFDLVTFARTEFSSLAAREEYIKNMSAQINRSVRQIRYLLYRNKVYGVKRISSEFSRFPTWCNLDISYKAYDIYGYGTVENVLNGDGTAINNGDEECYPIIILEGEQNNPTITINGIDYQIALDASANDIVTIDCGKEIVTLERDNEVSYLAGAFYLDFPVFKVGNNTVSGCTAVKWRNKYFTM